VTLVNATQPKTEAQRKIVTKGAAAVLGVAYDWVGIAEDAAGATLPAALTTRIEALWGSDWQGKGPPAHLVCSSLADWLYGSADLTNPNVHPTRNTTPADWATVDHPRLGQPDRLSTRVRATRQPSRVWWAPAGPAARTRRRRRRRRQPR